MPDTPKFGTKHPAGFVHLSPPEPVDWLVDLDYNDGIKKQIRVHRSGLSLTKEEAIEAAINSIAVFPHTGPRDKIKVEKAVRASEVEGK